MKAIINTNKMTRRQGRICKFAVAMMKHSKPVIDPAISERETKICMRRAERVHCQILRQDLFHISLAGSVMDIQDVPEIETEEERAKYIRDYIRKANDQGLDVYVSTTSEIFDFALANV